MPFATFGNDIFAIHGRQLLSSLLEKQPALPPTDSLPIPRFRSLSAHPSARSTNLNASSQSTLPAEPVGILGAGSSGLYAALILDDLGIAYKIIEARDRVGGRLYTHKFPNSTGAPFNYFDVGAMRFPEIAAMRRVFHLFHYSPLNASGINLEAKLKPYYFRGAANNDTLMSHNGVTVKQNAIPAGDPFKSAAVIQDTDPQPYLRVGAKAIADDVIEPFATLLLKDLEEGTDKGWEYLKKYDHYSTRAYMSLVYRPSAKLNLPNAPLPSDIINWVETFDKSTGWYDRALSETVLEAVAFGWSPSTNPMEATRWWCIDGGAYQIADCMAKYIRSRKRDAIVLNRRVTGIGLADDQTAIEVVTDGVDRQRFCHVISSIPLPVMRTIDLTKAGLTPMQSGALRQLNYGPSIKIGMQFRTAWWTTGLDKDGRPLNIIGGQSYTDTPLKTVVYPSFGDVKAGKTTTLIASYCWTEDAERLGTLIGNGDQILVELVLRELASIHNVTVDFLQGQLIDTFAWNWSRDPYTMGAFAFFGPGKFANVFNSLNTPAASGRLHFAGEAISVRHAWVEGALTSAWRSVFELVTLDEAFSEYRERFFQNWGVNAEFFERDSKALPRNAPIFATMPSESRRNKPSADLPTERVDLGNLLQGSLLMKAIAVTHPELV